MASHQRLVLTVLLGTFVLTRVGYFVGLNRSPCAHQHRWDQSDMHFFDVWARGVASGDWPSDRAMHPHHGWHRQVSERFFRDHPERLEAIPGEPEVGRPELDRSRRLWDRWYGGKRFHQEPLYPYLLALTYRVLGADVRWVFAWQMLLGASTVLLVYVLARRYFGVTAAALASMLAVLHAPFLFYEGLLLRATLITFCGLLLVCLTELALERGSLRRWFLTGLAFGGALLVKTTFLLLALGALSLLTLRLRRSRKTLVRCGIATIAGMALAVSPAVLRNLVVGTDPLGLSSVAAVSFVLSSADDFRPEQPGHFALEHAPEILGRTDGRFIPAVAETLRTHPHIGSYLGQLVRKFLWSMHWYERPDSANLYYYRLHAPILALLPVTFVVLGPLGILGLLLAAGERRRYLPLLFLVLFSLVPLALFFPLSRYRLPLAAALLPFAGLAVARLLEWMAERRWGVTSVAAVFLVALAVWIARPLPANVPLVRPVDYMAPYWTYYEAEERRARLSGDLERAASIVGASLATEPASVRRMVRSARLPSSGREVELARFYADVHSWYAETLERAGRANEARGQLAAARELRRKADTVTRSPESTAR